MSPSDFPAITSADVAVPSAAQLLRPVAARQFVTRCVEGLTWDRFLMVVAFCAIYAVALGMNPQTGGAPVSIVTYLVSFASSLTYFFPAFVLVAVATGFAPSHLVTRAAVLGFMVVIGIAIGYGLMVALRDVLIGWQVEPSHLRSPPSLIVTSWLGLAIYLMQERDQTAARSLHDELERQVNVDRQMSEAQLQVLQSQIEPHFLFNTLAHVRHLYRTEPRAGCMMMRHLSRYLSVALPALRETGIALGQDLDLAIAYLTIQQIRMGPRLTFEIDAPAETRQTSVPPMMITTLVENAIKHGLSPLPEGGVVRITARATGTMLNIDVADTGQGFQADLGTGVGLANVRARLVMLHGPAAKLILSQSTPRGVTVTILIPLLRTSSFR